MSAFIEASKEFFNQTGMSNDEGQYEIIRQCNSIVFCAGRATGESRALFEHEFLQLSRHIACKVRSLPDPSGRQGPLDIFGCHCTLDMAMRLHKRFPDIIDNTLFEALHTRSVKMFDLYVKHWRAGIDGKYIEGKPEGVPQTSDASIGPIDWVRVRDEYAEVEVRDAGESPEYGDQWDYQRLRVDYKHRMEFMLNDETYWTDEFRTMMLEHQF